MGLFDGFKTKIPDWKKRDYERCGKCGHAKMHHMTMCRKCRNCKSFLPSGNIGMGS